VVSTKPISVPAPWPILAFLIVLVGIASGLAGMLLARTLHLIQHLAYGYDLRAGATQESFLQGVSGVSPLHRVLVLCVCGLIAGCGWWAQHRFGRRLVSISEAVGERASAMPPLATTLHVLLQITTVALGSPLGREVAPAEMGAMLASWLCRRAGVSPEQARILIACGAGAGLAAVYNVPLGGALFTLEALLGSLELSAAIPALTTSAIAAYVAWIGLGDETPYTVANLAISPSLVLWSIATSPVFGLAGDRFARAAGAARAAAPRDGRLFIRCMLVFPVIGMIAAWHPQILGNGKGIAQLAFFSEPTVALAAVLLLIRITIPIGALGAGAAGGLMTPSMAIGALLAIVLGRAWNVVWPDIPSGAFAVVGAAAFLASSTKMPLTAVVLMMEFTRINHDFLIPIVLAVAGSVSIRRLLESRSRKTAIAHDDSAMDNAVVRSESRSVSR